jgi:superoxide dismutase
MKALCDFPLTLPCCLDTAGHINHSLFWTNLVSTSEGGGQLESGPLKVAIDRDFGSLGELKTTFNAQTAAIQGSGWGWLVRDCAISCFPSS